MKSVVKITVLLSSGLLAPAVFGAEAVGSDKFAQVRGFKVDLLTDVGGTFNPLPLGDFPWGFSAQHYPDAAGGTFLLGAGGPTPQRPVIMRRGQSTSAMLAFDAGPADNNAGVRVAAGDLNSDGLADIITATGPGGGPHVRVFNGSSGQPLLNFDAFDVGSALAGGVHVAAGDLNGDGFAEVVTATDNKDGQGLEVRVHSGSGLATGRRQHLPIRLNGFTGDADVAIGDFGGARSVIVAAAGSGGVHVKAFNGGSAAELLSLVVPVQGFTGGVRVASGDVDGDGLSDLIVSSSTSNGPLLQVFTQDDPTGAPTSFSLLVSKVFDTDLPPIIRGQALLDGDYIGRVDLSPPGASGAPVPLYVAGLTLLPEPASLTAMVGLASIAMRRRRR